jgi:hypothetical protein
MEMSRIEESAMFEKTSLFKVVIAALAVTFVLTGLASAQTARVQDKDDEARRLWQNSPHNDKSGEPFNHWNADGSIPTTCAKCHSTPGFEDYLGADGSTVDVVDNAAPIGTTIQCEACHSDPEKGILRDRTYVIFPSGVKVTGLGPESMCMECHQGRASTNSVDSAIAAAALASDDTPSSKLRFIDVHYFAAAATQFGTVAKGGYEYAGKSYDSRFAHVPGYNVCFICHNPHSLEVDIQACNTCHTGIKDPRDIRFYGSFVDYDGDGDLTEGMYYEIEHLKGFLLSTIQAYARSVVGLPIGYDPNTYPYVFIDLNGNGIVDASEANSANAYNKFTPRLLRAMYNYQVSVKDPCTYVHNGKYVIELIYDSIEDLNTMLGASAETATIRRPAAAPGLPSASLVRQAGRGKALPVAEERRLSDGAGASGGPALAADSVPPLSSLRRVDEGHFDGSAQPWRHFDSAGVVEADCAKCHSPEGLPYLLQNGEIDKALPIGNGLLCSTCHTVPPLTHPAGPVTFPSGAVVDLHDQSNLCMNCHQGRESKNSIDRTTSSSPGPYSFTNIHYYAAAASFFGSEVHGGYEFAGKTYTGRNIFTNHMGIFTDCIECHFSTKSFNRKHDDSDRFFHNAEPSPQDCVPCHGQDISQPHPGADPAQFEFEGIRPAQTPDYDGDGNTRESLRSEILGLEDQLYTIIQTYAAGIGAPVIYDENTYPYWFKDLNGNGIGDPNELIVPNGYKFTAPLLRAAYNLHFSRKEPCAYIHNALYFAQLLVDSIGSLGGNTSRFTWR